MSVVVLRIGLLIGLLGCAGGSSEDTDPVVPDKGELLGIGIFPRDPSVEVGESVAFVVKGFYENTSNEPVGGITWVSTQPRVAEIGPDGVARAGSPGVTTIVGTDARGVSAKTDLTVRGEGAGPTAVRLSPRAIELAIGGTVEMQAVATFADGTEGNVGASCAWRSEDEAVIQVDAAGSATGLAEGRTTVRATCGALDASAPAAVRAASDAPDLPDLVIGEVLTEVSGDELYLLFDVTNQGAGMSPVAFVDLFLDPPGEPGPSDTYVATEILDALAPGETALVWIAHAGIAPGGHEAWLVADADGWVAESDEGNNAAGPLDFEVGGAEGPNLVITDFDGFSDGDRTYYIVEVWNDGDESARDFWIDVYLNPEVDPDVCDYGDASIWIAELAPGEVVSWEPEFDEAPVSGEWFSVLYADSCDDVAESVEDDNVDYALISP